MEKALTVPRPLEAVRANHHDQRQGQVQLPGSALWRLRRVRIHWHRRGDEGSFHFRGNTSAYESPRRRVSRVTRSSMEHTERMIGEPLRLPTCRPAPPGAPEEAAKVS